MVDSISNSLVQSFPSSAATRTNNNGGNSAANQSEQSAPASAEVSNFREGNQLSNLRATINDISSSSDSNINLEVEGLNPDFDEAPVTAPEAQEIGSRLDITV